jgi:hypothetical protein
MSKLVNKDNWKDIKQKLIDKYPALTEYDFKAENAEKDDEMLIHLGQELGKTTEEMREIIRTINNK